MPRDNVPRTSGAPVPPLLPGRPPFAMLVDYDNTISQLDVSELLLDRFFDPGWRDDDRLYGEGVIGSRTFFERQLPALHADAEQVVATAAAQPHDPAFAPFVRRAAELDVPVEVVSDGLGFFIEPALERLGVPHVPVVTSVTTFEDGSATMSFPNGNPDCFVCGTCKRNRVLAHQAAGRAVVFVGDGESDRYAAAHADAVFAKGDLVAMCEAMGWPHREWRTFDDVGAWLEAAVEAWRVAPASALHPRAQTLLCGPEVWGPGRTNPPPNEPVRDRARPIEG